jgi:hypothetical protein
MPHCTRRAKLKSRPARTIPREKQESARRRHNVQGARSTRLVEWASTDRRHPHQAACLLPFHRIGGNSTDREMRPSQLLFVTNHGGQPPAHGSPPQPCAPLQRRSILLVLRVVKLESKINVRSDTSSIGLATHLNSPPRKAREKQAELSWREDGQRAQII